MLSNMLVLHTKLNVLVVFSVEFLNNTVVTVSVPGSTHRMNVWFPQLAWTCRRCNYTFYTFCRSDCACLIFVIYNCAWYFDSVSLQACCSFVCKEKFEWCIYIQFMGLCRNIAAFYSLWVVPLLKFIQRELQ